LGLKGEGFVEGENVVVEYRSAENQLDRLPAIAAEVVRQRVAVIVTVGGDPSIVAAKSATTAIPIIFNTGTDPVRAGHVASMNSPGGNATGVNLFTGELGPKRLSLLSDLLPTASHLAILFNPNVPLGVINADQAETAARNLGKQVKKYTASSNEEIDAAFAAIAQDRVNALLVAAEPTFNARRDRIVALAARYSLPTMYEQREFAVAGGLISYGTSLVETYRLQGLYAGKILKGANVSDLPVIQLSKFELVINLRTAKALGLTIPSGLLSIVDDVIE
jgi:putative ABC transport system substrate-binding protein